MTFFFPSKGRLFGKIWKPQKSAKMTPTLEWPMLWRITMNSLQNEGIYEWVNKPPIFFWYQLPPTTYGLQQFAKISIFKLDNFVLSIYLVPKLKSVAQIEWKKHPYFFFFYLWFKNKRVLTEKIKKKRKNSKDPKDAGNNPNI